MAPPRDSSVMAERGAVIPFDMAEHGYRAHPALAEQTAALTAY
jgi:hypothetical protein